jgi:AcrR family transcriptional regulator
MRGHLLGWVQSPTRERDSRRAAALFASCGYEGVGARDVALALRSSVGSLYRHHGGKEAVRHAVLAEADDALAHALGQALARVGARADFPTRFRALWGVLLSFCRQERHLMHFAHLHWHPPEAVSALRERRRFITGAPDDESTEGWDFDWAAAWEGDGATDEDVDVPEAPVRNVPRTPWGESVPEVSRWREQEGAEVFLVLERFLTDGMQTGEVRLLPPRVLATLVWGPFLEVLRREASCEEPLGEEEQWEAGELVLQALLRP